MGHEGQATLSMILQVRVETMPIPKLSTSKMYRESGDWPPEAHPAARDKRKGPQGRLS
jgi:hypothetical protein